MLKLLKSLVIKNQYAMLADFYGDFFIIGGLFHE
jgi:hypothetical protein